MGHLRLEQWLLEMKISLAITGKSFTLKCFEIEIKVIDNQS